jgi:hypothetical protein
MAQVVEQLLKYEVLSINLSTTQKKSVRSII